MGWMGESREQQIWQSVIKLNFEILKFKFCKLYDPLQLNSFSHMTPLKKMTSPPKRDTSAIFPCFYLRILPNILFPLIFFGQCPTLKSHFFGCASPPLKSHQPPLSHKKWMILNLSDEQTLQIWLNVWVWWLQRSFPFHSYRNKKRKEREKKKHV